MGISVFPAGGGGEFITNDFVVDMNDTDNNVIDLGRTYAEGAYDVALATGDTTFDIYAVNDDGNLVGYTNDATLVTTGGFTQLAILGVSSTERITFSFSGASNNATGEGTLPGAGAYLESINPSDLPNIDDTANIIGGNFATDVEIYFESGTVSTEAKNVVRSDSTALVVTRPDALDPALDPWDVKAINPGVNPPTGTNANILAGTVDAGAVPIWTTTSPLPAAGLTQAYSATVVATDADGDVDYSITAGSLPTGLSLDSETGVISGTPTTGSETFTIQALDEGGNANDREFALPVNLATGGTISQDGNYTVHTFNSSGDFEAFDSLTAEYIVLAGAGGGGHSGGNSGAGGAGGGGGGYRSSITGDDSGGGTNAEASLSISSGTYSVTIGAGGSGGSTAGQIGGNGTDTTFSNITSTGGGGGGSGGANGQDGGSGGGAGQNRTPGNGTLEQGFDGGGSNAASAGGGGGAAEVGETTNNYQIAGDGGLGVIPFIDSDSWGAGGGGAALDNLANSSTGKGGSNYAGNGRLGGSSLIQQSTAGSANFGGGGGGGGTNNSPGRSGGSGKVIVRYEA